MTGKPFIRAGEWLTCAKGHRYACAHIDIGRGDPVRRTDFEFVGEPPAAGDLMGPCWCGAHRTFEDSKGTTPYIEGRGWLKTPPPA
jgi:hypothetical protein